MLQKIKSFFALLKTAIRGEEENFTTGSIDRSIFLLSVPMILEMAMEALFAIVDVFFVSSLNDNNAVAVIGLTESVITLVYSVAIGISMGATAMVARRVGEKNIDAAKIAAMQSIYIAVAISVVLGVTGFIYAADILKLMGATDAIISTGVNYTRWMFGGNISIMLLFLINGIFRGAGNASLAMRALILSNGLNIVLDPILIFGWGPIPSFGVEGAAIATTIGRSTGVLYQIYHLTRGDGLIKLNRKSLVVDWGIIGRLLKVSAGGTGQFLIASASWIFLIRIISTFGSAALAGYTIGIRVIVFAILPAWGMSNAAATLVGQNLGANLPERAEQSVWRSAFLTMVFLGFISVVFFLGADIILGFFKTDNDSLYYGVQCLRIVSIGYIFYAYGMVLSQSFNGAGDTRTPTILNFFAFWMLQIPLAYLLSITFEMGPAGAFSAIAISESILAIACIIIFKRGKWKTTVI